MTDNSLLTESQGNPVMGTDESLALLRRFEPVIRYTRGELFLPMAVEDYIAASALVQGAGKGRRVVVERGQLTLELLSDQGARTPGTPLSLEHVGDPLDRSGYRAWRKRPDRAPFVASSRFAAVGLAARMIDALMRLTLLLRGRVPGGFTAAAHQSYAGSPSGQRCVYYGRVTQDGGYTVAQYWYFYAMNDWRSTFGGINDHEADWEQVTIFLVPDGEDVRPAWVAFSSHDEVGDDLRRRWDDPDMDRVGEHPVVYAGAGSHSGAYLPGEYVVSTPVPVPRWLRGARSVWIAIRPWAHGEQTSILSIPYIDYRRGDGTRVGAQGDLPWSPVLIDDQTPWVRDFRGLWGLDTSDPLGGERAPAGPRYERGGSVRQSWGQPVAWAGLDKEPPSPEEALARLRATRGRLEGELAAVQQDLEFQRERLRGGRAAEQANGISVRSPGARVTDLQATVTELRDRQAELRGVLEALDTALAVSPAPAPVHAHLSHRSLPIEGAGQGRVLRFWAAASVTVLLAALGILLLVDGNEHISVFEILGAMLVIEAVLRRRWIALVAGLLIIVVAVVGLSRVFSVIIDYSTDALGVLLLVAAAYVGWTTIKEAFATR